jgi:hypothetical protein
VRVPPEPLGLRTHGKILPPRQDSKEVDAYRTSPSGTDGHMAGRTTLQVHEPELWQFFVQVEGVGQSASEQIVAPLQVISQPFPVQVVLQLPTF